MEPDERIIRNIVEQAVARLNQGDLSAFDDFWDENADYVGVDGRILIGRPQIKSFFRELLGASGGQMQQSGRVEQVRFLTADLAIVDGSWQVTGARDASGVELPPIRGMGAEIVQRKDGRWIIVATREKVIFSVG